MGIDEKVEKPESLQLNAKPLASCLIYARSLLEYVIIIM